MNVYLHLDKPFKIQLVAKVFAENLYTLNLLSKTDCRIKERAQIGRVVKVPCSY